MHRAASACSTSTRASAARCWRRRPAARETLAAEASLAIENARLYRSALEKAKLEQDIRIAAEIQQALLPKPRHGGAFFETAATTIPCRSIGGDFYDVMDLTGDVLGFALGDVAGKGRRPRS